MSTRSSNLIGVIILVLAAAAFYACLSGCHSAVKPTPPPGIPACPSFVSSMISCYVLTGKQLITEELADCVQCDGASACIGNQEFYCVNTDNGCLDPTCQEAPVNLQLQMKQRRKQQHPDGGQ